MKQHPQVREASDIFKKLFEQAGVEMTPDIEASIERACELLYNASVEVYRQYPEGYRPTARRDR